VFARVETHLTCDVMEAILKLYEAGGLSLLVVVGLGAAVVLLYRELKAARVAHAKTEKESARQLLDFALKLASLRSSRTTGERSVPFHLADERPTGIHNLPSYREQREMARVQIDQDLEELLREYTK
jgi:hypothetical protein